MTAPDDYQDAFHLEPALLRLGNNRGLFNDLVGFFLEDHPVLLNQLGKAIDENDGRLATRAAHSLKGLSASFDSHVVVNLAERIEKLADHGDWADAGRLVGQLEAELVRLRDALVAHLEREKTLGT